MRQSSFAAVGYGLRYMKELKVENYMAVMQKRYDRICR